MALTARHPAHPNSIIGPPAGSQPQSTFKVRRCSYRTSYSCYLAGQNMLSIAAVHLT